MEIKNSLLDPATGQNKRTEVRDSAAGEANPVKQEAAATATVATDQISISNQAIQRAASGSGAVQDFQQAQALSRQVAESMARDPQAAMGAFSAASNDSLNLLAG